MPYDDRSRPRAAPSNSSGDSGASPLLTIAVGVVAVACCAAPFFAGALAAGSFASLLGAHQTLAAVAAAAFAIALAVMVGTRPQRVAATLREATRLAFAPQARLRSILLLLLVGVPLTFFYLLALPAERFGALALGALAFLTPGDALAAVLLGFGVALSFALNLAAHRARAAQTSLTFGGVVAALLPSSLCCTTLIPSALAALGASAPAVMHLSGRFQGFFAQYAAAFVGTAVAAVLFSVWLAARNLSGGASCALSIKESSL